MDSGIWWRDETLQDHLIYLRDTVDTRLGRVAHSVDAASEVLRTEIAQAKLQFHDSSTQLGSRLASEIQLYADYLGGEVAEVRWAVERQVEVSQQILDSLLNAL